MKPHSFMEAQNPVPEGTWPGQGNGTEVTLVSRFVEDSTQVGRSGSQSAADEHDWVQSGTTSSAHRVSRRGRVL